MDGRTTSVGTLGDVGSTNGLLSGGGLGRGGGDGIKGAVKKGTGWVFGVKGADAPLDGGEG